MEHFIFNLINRRVDGSAEPRQLWIKEAWAKLGAERLAHNRSVGPEVPVVWSQSLKAAQAACLRAPPTMSPAQISP